MLIKRILQLALVVSILWTTAGAALPVGWTSATVNGANVVVDTSDNEWLSPVYSVGDSYQTTMATSSWVHNLGFQSVTRTAFVGLLASYGLPSSTPDFNGNGSVDTNEQISGSGL